VKDSANAESGEAFARLLAALDPDPERAGERYLVLRRKLLAFFEWRGAPAPDASADRTLDIAARRIAGGEHVRNVSNYCVGIARIVLLEALRNRKREQSAIQGLAASLDPSAQEDDALRDAFDRCLEALPEDSRDLILTYYSAEGRSRVDTREQLAARLAIPVSALRIRAYRVRVRLEAAVKAALAGDEGRKK
jgi:DNA-directed RNA polymerase specialized sigma24 family protein